MLRLTVLWMLALLLAPSARAAEGPAPAPDSAIAPAAPAHVTRAASHGAWVFSAAVSRQHDDNILRLPRLKLDRLAANPLPPRFLVVTPDDDIMEYSATAGRRLRLLPHRETRVQASVDVNRFQRNTVKNWEQYELEVQQELSATRRALSALRLWWNTMPQYYLGEVTDADESVAALQRIRRSQTFAQTGVGFRLSQRLPGRVSLGVGEERKHRDYNAHFKERDNDDTEGRLEAGLQPFRRWGMTAGVTYLGGRLDAQGDLATTEIRDTDISYDHHSLGANIMLPWGGHESSRGRLQAAWMPETRRYTTGDKYDLKRYGRVNRREATSVRVTQHVWGPVEAIATYDKLTSDATFPDGIVFSEDATDYSQTRWGITLRVR